MNLLKEARHLKDLERLRGGMMADEKRLTTDDRVPPEVKGLIQRRLDEHFGPDGGSSIEVFVSRRDNPDEIYEVRVRTPEMEASHDFQQGDIEEGRFDLWLEQQGEHLPHACWCGHEPAGHDLPRCGPCENL
jgi:hypothetical protein